MGSLGGFTLTLALSPQGRGDRTPRHIPLLRPFDSAQGERNPPPLGMDSGSGGRNDGREGRGRVDISCWRQSGG